MSFSSFMNNVGNAFKTGWNNGNLQKGIAATGMFTLNTGLTGAMIHDMNKSSCCGGPSIFNGMWGAGLNYPIGMNLLGGSLYGMGGFMGMPNSYTGLMGTGISPMTGIMNNGVMSLTGGMDPYEYGKMYMEQLKAQYPELMQSNGTIAGLSKQNNEYAGKWDASQSTEKGERFDSDLDEMIDKDNNAVEGKEIKLTTATGTDSEQYKKDISDIAKSYAAHIDKTSGNSDQELTMEEYIKYELSKLPDDATEEQKQNIRLGASYAFSRMDLNQDKKVDWKELAATIATYDTDDNGIVDGKIDSNAFKKQAELLVDPTKPTFSQTLIKNYNRLFGKDK